METGSMSIREETLSAEPEMMLIGLGKGVIQKIERF